MVKLQFLSIFFFLLILTINSGCGGDDILSFEDAVMKCDEEMAIRKANKEDGMSIYKDNLVCIIGAKMPEFEAKTIDEKPIDKNYFSGKVNIINFWFDRCKPCIAEIPGFNALVKKYEGQDVNFLAISTDKKIDIETYIQKAPFNFDHVAQGTDLYRKTFKSKSGFPYTLVIDKQNIIRHVISGGRVDSLAIQMIQDKLVPVIDQYL